MAQMSPRVFLAILLLSSTLLVDCTDKRHDCYWTATCEEGGTDAGGQSTGGKTQSGGRTSSGGNASSGNSSGGAAGSGTAGTSSTPTAGTAGQAPCNGTCAAPTPYCRPDTNVCVACTDNTHCSGASPVCDTTKNVCVGCTSKEHCAAPKGVCTSDSVCVECVTSTDCTYSTAKPACRTDSKTCVECTSNVDCKDPSKTVCDTTNNVCVGCLSSTDCADSTQPGYNANKLLCKPESKACVSCLANADCKTAAASKCDITAGSPTANTCLPCTADTDCSQVTGKTVCLAGTTPQTNQCVQCTGKKYAACGQSSGKALVCDSVAHTCSPDKTAQSVGLCAPCISDAQCLAGQLCAPQSFQGQPVSNFCFWKQGDIANGAPADCTTATNRPYVNIQSNAVSIDSETATLCTLRAVTTCPALNQYSTANCASPSNTPDDTLCGFAHGVDSKCVAFGANQFRCTTVCLSSDDCRPGATCNTSATPAVCSL